MTNQHRATPDDWAQQEDWANRSAFPDSSCIIELRDRLEALEVAQQPLVNYAPVKPEQWEQRAVLIERLSRLEEGYDELLVRIEALEAAQQPRAFTGQVVAPITNQTGPGVALYLDPSERQHGVTGTRTTLHSYKAGKAEPVEDWGKGHTLVSAEADQRGAVNEAELQKARDEELEECRDWIEATLELPGCANQLRLARRPKPPSLKQELLQKLERISDVADGYQDTRNAIDDLRSALEALDE